MNRYFQLFLSFFKIGAFTIGGGYVMIPLIEQEVVERRRWIEREEFTEMLTLAQSAPGPISINSAVFVGYKTLGLGGMLTAVLATTIPSFVVPVVNMLKNSGFRPGVVALAVVAALAVWQFSVSPVWVIAAAGVAGVVYHTWIAKTKNEK